MEITNFDELMRLCNEARTKGHGSKPWIEFATVMMDSWPAIYDKAKDLNSLHFRLCNQVATGKDIVAAGVELMTAEQVGKWAGVRSFLEQDEGAYSDQPHNAALTGETPNGGTSG